MFAVDWRRRTIVVDILKLAMPPNVAALFHVDFDVRALENDHPFHRRPAAQRVIHILFEWNDSAAAITRVRRNQRDRPAIVDTIADRIRAETAENDRMHRADTRTGQHGNGDFGGRRHVNDDAIAFADLVSFQDVREAANLAMQLLVSERALLARFAFPQDRRLVAAVCKQMSIQTVFGKIELASDEPFREGRFPFEDFAPSLAPVEFSRLA